MHIAAAQAVQQQLLPAIRELREGLQEQAERHAYLCSKQTGRTTAMDATPMTFGQEFGFVAQLGYAEQAIQGPFLPAVWQSWLRRYGHGTGLNSPQGFVETAQPPNWAH